ncbi:hypothetical protein T492DRAFT_358213 [Pavlovales sp. CCMP2436]|nr:hypothetical protein T492DRAFT_358213 [Pavlovales sp. CCMP2436]
MNAYYKLFIYDTGPDGFCCAYGQGSLRVDISGREVGSARVQVGSSTSWSDSELYFFFDTLAPILLVEFTPDAYPQEIHWDLYRAPGDYSGDSYVHVQSDEVYDFEPTYPAEWRLQLAAGAFFYFLLVSDRGSDGICCAYGQGSLRVHISGREVAPASTSWSEMEFDSSTEVRLVYYFDSFPPTTILRVKITPDSKPEEIYWVRCDTKCLKKPAYVAHRTRSIACVADTTTPSLPLSPR